MRWAVGGGGMEGGGAGPAAPTTGRVLRLLGSAREVARRARRRGEGVLGGLAGLGGASGPPDGGAGGAPGTAAKAEAAGLQASVQSLEGEKQLFEWAVRTAGLGGLQEGASLRAGGEGEARALALAEEAGPAARHCSVASRALEKELQGALDGPGAPGRQGPGAGFWGGAREDASPGAWAPADGAALEEAVRGLRSRGLRVQLAPRDARTWPWGAGAPSAAGRDAAEVRVAFDQFCCVLSLTAPGNPNVQRVAAFGLDEQREGLATSWAESAHLVFQTLSNEATQHLHACKAERSRRGGGEEEVLARMVRWLALRGGGGREDG